jgi:hypothetical protein
MMEKNRIKGVKECEAFLYVSLEFILLLNFCSMDWSLSINGTQLTTLGATTAPHSGAYGFVLVLKRCRFS